MLLQNNNIIIIYILITVDFQFIWLINVQYIKLLQLCIHYQLFTSQILLRCNEAGVWVRLEKCVIWRALLYSILKLHVASYAFLNDCIRFDLLYISRLFDIAIYRVLYLLWRRFRSPPISCRRGLLLSDAFPPRGWLAESDSPARRKYADASRSGAREQLPQRAPPVRRSSDTCRGSGRAYGALTARLEPERAVSTCRADVAAVVSTVLRLKTRKFYICKVVNKSYINHFRPELFLTL